MADVVVSTERFSEDERFGRWCEMVSQTLMPVKVINTGQHSFSGDLRIVNLGSVRVQLVRTTPCLSVRTARMVRQSDPEFVQLVLVRRGLGAIEQNRNYAPIEADDLVYYDSSRPSLVDACMEVGEAVRGITAIMPRALIPLPPAVLQQWSATTFAAQRGPARLLATVLSQLATDADTYAPADATRLGTILTDLFAMSAAHQLGTADSLPPDTREQVLFIQVQDFIGRHLTDPDLTPAMVAAAHHISVRTLHRLFQAHNCTTASWIRQQRLQRCRDDFANPRLRHRSILAIANHWGFTDPAHFSRLFRCTYGLSPRNYRANSRSAWRASSSS